LDYWKKTSVKYEPEWNKKDFNLLPRNQEIPPEKNNRPQIVVNYDKDITNFF